MQLLLAFLLLLVSTILARPVHDKNSDEGLPITASVSAAQQDSVARLVSGLKERQIDLPVEYTYRPGHPIGNFHVPLPDPILPREDLESASSVPATLSSSVSAPNATLAERAPAYTAYEYRQDPKPPHKWHSYVCQYTSKKDKCRKCEWRSIPHDTDIEGYGTKGYELKPCKPTPKEMEEGSEEEQVCKMPVNGGYQGKDDKRGLRNGEEREFNDDWEKKPEDHEPISESGEQDSKGWCLGSWCSDARRDVGDVGTSVDVGLPPYDAEAERDDAWYRAIPERDVEDAVAPEDASLPSSSAAAESDEPLHPILPVRDTADSASDLLSSSAASEILAPTYKVYRYRMDNKPYEGCYNLYVCKDGLEEKCKRINWRHIPKGTEIENYGTKTTDSQPRVPPLWVENGTVRLPENGTDHAAVLERDDAVQDVEVAASDPTEDDAEETECETTKQEKTILRHGRTRRMAMGTYECKCLDGQQTDCVLVSWVAVPWDHSFAHVPETDVDYKLGHSCESDCA